MPSRAPGSLRSNAALIMSAMALVMASGGTAYAAVKIGTKDLKSNAVTSSKIKNRTIQSVDLARGVAVSGPQGPAGSPGAPGAFPTELSGLVPVALFVVNGTTGAVTRDTHRAPMTAAPTVVRNSAGNYTVTLPGIAFQPVTGSANCTASEPFFVGISGSASKMTVKVGDKNGDAADAPQLRCVVWDSPGA